MNKKISSLLELFGFIILILMPILVGEGTTSSTRNRVGVLAATFDAPLLPGITEYDLGTESQPWRSLYLKDFKIGWDIDGDGIIEDTEVGRIYQPRNYSIPEVKTRGLMVVGAYRGQQCCDAAAGSCGSGICKEHTGACGRAIKFDTDVSLGVSGLFVDCNITLDDLDAPSAFPLGGFCFCH